MTPRATIRLQLHKDFGFDDAALGKHAAQVVVVHVPEDRVHLLDAGQPGELRENGGARHVPGVHDDRGGAKQPQAGCREPPPAARHVRVADDRDQESPSTKLPSR